MGVDTPRGDDLAFSCDDLGTRSDDYIDVGLHIGIAGLPDPCDEPILDSDVRLHDPPMIKNQSVGNNCINRSLAARTLRLSHAITNDFPAAELHLLTIGREIFLYLDEQVSICEPNLVPDRRTEHLRVGGTAHCVGHFRYLNCQNWPQRRLRAVEPPSPGHQSHRLRGHRYKGSMKLRGTAPAQIARPSRPGYRGDNRQQRFDRKRGPHLSRRNDSDSPLEWADLRCWRR